jgi:hypothetical protein
MNGGFTMRNLLVFITIFTVSLIADDGMWMPHQMKALNLQAKGLKMNPSDLYKKDGTGLMSAIVSLGGGTGEFVSSQGLILTNHHVAFGALQRASTPETDYITNGFLAETIADEIPAPGNIADVLIGYKEVTDQITSAVSEDMSYYEKHKVVERRQNELIAEAEKADIDLHCRVAAMYSGNQYYLFTFKRLKDIRIVYAPPRDLGNFGGDIDNWMWPRHTCDFTFLRAYVSPQNEGAEYSTENVPYKPKSVLTISMQGVNDGDFTFVMGYPGRTYRNYTVSELMYDIERMKRRSERFTEIIQFFETAGKVSKEIEIKYARKVRGLNNALKNYKGKLEGFESAGIMKRKKKYEDKLVQLFTEQERTDALHGLQILTDFMNRYSAFNMRYQSLNNLVNRYFGPSVLAQTHTVVRASLERQKPDLEREDMFQERNRSRLKSRIELAERGYDFEIDKLYFMMVLNWILTSPEEQVPGIFKGLTEFHSAEEFVNSLYLNTNMMDAEKRLKYIEMNPDELKKLDDPLLNFAFKLENELKDLRKQNEAMTQERADLKKPYLRTLLDINPAGQAADANSTIRFTYGNVEGYQPRDAVYYQPQTTVSGVIEKDSGEFPFHVPQKLKQVHQAGGFADFEDPELGDIPACFLNTTNVTGGNSGSPTLNAYGEQVGIIFDMTYESVIGDYYVVSDLQRTISVDMKYVLFITEKFSGAGHLLKEMGLR